MRQPGYNSNAEETMVSLSSAVFDMIKILEQENEKRIKTVYEENNKHIDWTKFKSSLEIVEQL